MEEMRGKIHRGEIGPQDLICGDDDKWMPAIEWGVFEFQLFPATQGVVQGAEFDLYTREWVLLKGQGEGGKALQEGPFAIEELREGLIAGTVSPYQYVWKTGLSGWCQLKDRPEFAPVISSERLSDPSPV